MDRPERSLVGSRGRPVDDGGGKGRSKGIVKPILNLLRRRWVSESFPKEFCHLIRPEGGGVHTLASPDTELRPWLGVTKENNDAESLGLRT